MTTRKDERERLREAREEKEADQKSRERKRLIAAYGAAGVVAVIVIVGGIIALSGGGGGGSADAHVSLQSGQTNGLALDERDGTVPVAAKEADLRIAAQKADCDLREKLPIAGRSHIPQTAPTPDYKTDPPTSGNHVVPPYQQADGAYIDPPEPMNVVHSLEHGRMALQYSPELEEADQLELRGFYDTVHAGALFFPNETMPYEVALSSWGNLIGCERYQGKATLDALRAFGAKNFGIAPEPVEAFGPLAGPTFAEPS